MKISSCYRGIFYLCISTQRSGISGRMNQTINCRAPGEIYGWPCGGMKSLIFFSALRSEFQTRSWLKKYRATRGSYDGSGGGGDDKRYGILLRNFNLNDIHGYPAAYFISRSFIFDLPSGITNLQSRTHNLFGKTDLYRSSFAITYARLKLTVSIHEYHNCARFLLHEFE